MKISLGKRVLKELELSSYKKAILPLEKRSDTEIKCKKIQRKEEINRMIVRDALSNEQVRDQNILMLGLPFFYFY